MTAAIDRPREKLARKGSAALSDTELLQAMIGSGTQHADVRAIARDVKKLLQSCGVEIGYAELKTVVGLGPAKITELLAAFELSRRYLLLAERPVIDSIDKAVVLFDSLRHKKQEYFMCVSLDGANRLIASRVIAIGTLTSSLVHPREVFADAITDRAASIIIAHNHPSGNLSPSAADIDVTDRISRAGELLGINLIDHMIITKLDYVSIKS